MKDLSYQIKVGLVVVIGIILSVMAYRAVLELNRESGFSVIVEFEDARGIKKGTAVQRAGTDIGWVSKMELDSDRGIAVGEVNIFAGKSFPKDAQFFIMSEGLIEEKFLAIKDNPNPNPLLGDAEDGDVFQGIPDPGLTDMISNANLALMKANTLLDVVTDFVSEEKLGGIITSLATEMEETMVTANSVMQRADRILAANEGRISETMENVHAMSEDVSAMTGDLRATLTDADLGNRLTGILDQVDTLLVQVNRISADVGKISGDEQVQADIKESIALTKSTLEEAEVTLRTLRGTLERVNEKIDNIGPVGFEGKVNVRNESVHQMNRSDSAYVDVKTRLRVGDSALDLGVENIGDEAQDEVGVNVQAGRYLSDDVLLRGGIFRSEFGLGFDYSPTGGFSFTGDVYDLNNPRANSYLSFPLMDKYNLLFGIEDIGDENQLNAGVQLSF
ncbi:MCE family protein [bacterium]|nr:MCE family protein [bacterium]